MDHGIGAGIEGAVAADDGVGPGHGVGAAAILERLDRLSDLLTRTVPPAPTADDPRPTDLDATVSAALRRQDAEVAALRGSLGAQVDASEAAAVARIEQAEARLEAQIAMQGQIIEALLAERDRVEADRQALDERVATALAQADDASRRLADLDRAASGGGEGLAAALGECSKRLHEVLWHLETTAVDRLPGGGRSIRDALEALSDRIASLAAIPDAFIAVEAAPDGRAIAPEAVRHALAAVLDAGQVTAA